MFELLNAYETARNEKNEFFRFFYIRYVRHKLKKSFFKPFKEIINSMALDKKLLVEFRQLFNCVGVQDPNNLNYTHINFVLDNGDIMVSYYDYTILYMDKENHYDIQIENMNRNIIIHPENAVFEHSLFSIILIMAIYNYCVTYIYGKYSSLHIDNYKYVETIKSTYF